MHAKLAALGEHVMHNLVSMPSCCRLLVQYSDPLLAGGSLAVVDPSDGSLTDLHTPFTSFGSLSVQEVLLLLASLSRLM